MSNRRGTKSISVYWIGNKNYSCPKIGATKIFCVLDKGYNSNAKSIMTQIFKK